MKRRAKQKFQADARSLRQVLEELSCEVSTIIEGFDSTGRFDETSFVKVLAQVEKVKELQHNRKVLLSLTRLSKKQLKKLFKDATGQRKNKYADTLMTN